LINEKFMSARKYIGLLSKAPEEEKCSNTLSVAKLDNLMKSITTTQLSMMKLSMGNAKRLIQKDFTEDLFPQLDFE
jgi:hypothetical protein